MKLKPYWTGLIAIAVLALAATLTWLSFRGPLVTAFEARNAPLVRSLQFSARVASLSRVDVGSTITARVDTVLVGDGAVVRQGDVLVQLESSELQAALSQAQASASQAQARLAGLRSTGRTSAQAAVMQTDATVRAAQAELARSQQLVAQGFISASRLDDVQRALDVARAQQASAQAQALANADTGTDVAQAQAQLDQARAAVATAQARLTQTRVTAPANARVLTRQVESGQIVQPGKALLSLALAGPVQLVAQVDERFLEQLRVGQNTSVVADAFADQRFTAQVLSIAPAVDAQRGAVEVKFSLSSAPPAFLREDMTLSVEVETARRERALVLPLAALRSQAGSTSNASNAIATVFIAQGGRVQSRTLRFGLRTLDAVEVLEGLAPGERVLLGGQLKPGQRVRLDMQAWRPGASSAGPGALMVTDAAATTQPNATGR